MVARATKVLAAVLAVAAVLMALTAAGLWWWSGSDGSLEWVLRRIAQSQPMTAQGVKGSLRSGLQVQRLVWERDDLRIEASDIELEWQPLGLFDGTIKLDKVHAAALRITDRRPPEPKRPPLSLMLRPRLVLDDLKIAQIEWVTGRTIQASALAGRYSFDGAAHFLRLDSLQLAGGTYSGEGKLGALSPMPVEARVSGKFDAPVPGASAKLPMEFSAKVQGPLADMRAEAWLRDAAEKSATSEPTQGTASARITPWAAQPVPQAQADLLALDLGALWPEAPRTRLAGHIRLAPAGTATWQVTADLRNDMAGPWDKKRLPVERVKMHGEWRDGLALVQSLEARLGAGELRANGQWQQGAKGWSVKGILSGIDPAALHSQMAAAPLGGRVDVRQEGAAILFDADLQASGISPKGRAARGANQPEIAAVIGALELRKVTAQGRWMDGRLSLPALLVRTTDARLQGTLDLTPQARAGSGRLELQAPGLRANVSGDVAETRGRGSLQAESNNLAATQRWVQRLPGMSAVLRGTAVGGRADVKLVWQGGWADPDVQLRLALPTLEWRDAGNAKAVPWVVRDSLATLDGRLGDARLAAQVRGRQGQREVTLDLSGRGGRAPMRRGGVAIWQGNIASLTVAAQDPAISTGTWRLALQRAFDVRWTPTAQSLEVGASQAVLTAPSVKATAPASQALLAWEPVRWGGGELRTAGRLTGLPLGWIELVGGPQLAGSALSGDMVFDAQWDANLGRTVRLNASLARSRGDVTVLADSAQGISVRVPAGVREARLTVTSQGEQVTLSMRWDSERAGVADGTLATRLAPGGPAGWQWPESAPVTGSLRAQLPRIGVWSLLAPPGWRLRGSLAADLKVAGNRSDPQFAGTIAADDLALRSVVDGIELRDGRLRARLEGSRLLVTDFTLHGAGEGGDGGTLLATGEAAWVRGAPQLQARARMTKLRASIRADRQLTVSGDVSAQMSDDAVEIKGRLKVEKALIVLPAENEPKLGDDVVIRDQPASAASKRIEPLPAENRSARPLAVAVDLDLGDDFQVSGRGLQTRLRGALVLAGRSITSPSLTGTITTAGGEYRAYNQRLDVERGVLRFTGRIDNPSLDILAVRPNLTQRVGVLITGNAQAPFVRLYAEPDLPDAEKLAWLVTGRAAPSGGAEAALVQQAALAFLSSRRPGSQGVAAAIGLDELSVRRDSTAGAVVTLGKRFARNFYASYERSLSGALGTLYIFYDVSQRLTVRAQAGERAGVDLIFTFSFN